MMAVVKVQSIHLELKKAENLVLLMETQMEYLMGIEKVVMKACTKAGPRAGLMVFPKVVMKVE